jgi:hypothetical protein
VPIVVFFLKSRSQQDLCDDSRSGPSPGGFRLLGLDYERDVILLRKLSVLMRDGLSLILTISQNSLHFPVDSSARTTPSSWSRSRSPESTPVFALEPDRARSDLDPAILGQSTRLLAGHHLDLAERNRVRPRLAPSPGLRLTSPPRDRRPHRRGPRVSEESLPLSGRSSRHNPENLSRISVSHDSLRMNSSKLKNMPKKKEDKPLYRPTGLASGLAGRMGESTHAPR